MENSEEIILTKNEAYRAMYAFLKIQYDISKTIDVEWLLSAMQLISGGNSADPAMWEDWEDAIKIALDDPDNANLRFIKD